MSKTKILSEKILSEKQFLNAEVTGHLFEQQRSYYPEMSESAKLLVRTFINTEEGWKHNFTGKNVPQGTKISKLLEALGKNVPQKEEGAEKTVEEKTVEEKTVEETVDGGRRRRRKRRRKSKRKSKRKTKRRRKSKKRRKTKRKTKRRRRKR